MLFYVSLSLSMNNGVVGSVLEVLILIARCLSAVTIRKCWKNKCLLLIGPGNYLAHLGHTARLAVRVWMGLGLTGSLVISEFKT